MSKEIIDGSVCTELFTEAESTWHIIQREGGSVCLYATHPHYLSGAHLIVYDSLDDAKPNAWATQQVARLAEMHEAIGALLDRGFWTCTTCGAQFPKVRGDETTARCSACVEVAALRAALAEAQERAGRAEEAAQAYLDVATYPEWSGNDCRLCAYDYQTGHASDCRYALAENALRLILETRVSSHNAEHAIGSVEETQEG